MDPEMARADLRVLIVVTVIGILLSAASLWTHTRVGDMEFDAGVAQPVAFAWDVAWDSSAR